jgi:ubiquinone/menaquinone biosynthesis C-methylase UbiE
MPVGDKWGFDRWAETYDKDIFDTSRPDQFTFRDYHRVLEKVVEYADPKCNEYSRVLDIGIGTGNLARLFLPYGLEVIGIDPSPEMMKVCRLKHPEIPVMPGDFLDIPLPSQSTDLIVSSYAFHHLTAEEKAEAAQVMKRVLRPGGRIVIADLMFRNAAERNKIEDEYRNAGRNDIVEEYENEYPGYFEDLVRVFDRTGFVTGGERFTESVWIILALLPLKG